VDLPPGLKQKGATFDRFGLHNMMKAGDSATMYFDDLRFDGQTQDFSQDPGWIGAGNRSTFAERAQAGAHDFGFSPKTSFAGGALGEAGGILWRGGNYAYYADVVGPLDLRQRLEARGKVILVTAGPDSDVYLGWFNHAAKEKAPAEVEPFVGIHVGGPTRVGHYFIPVFTTAKGTKGRVKQGPVLAQGKAFAWSLVYDPAANEGNGLMRVTLGTESVSLALKPGQKAEDASLDRFGLFNATVGGQMVKLYLDDLTYTARGPVSRPHPRPHFIAVIDAPRSRGKNLALPRPLTRPACQGAATGHLGSIHLRILWGGGPDARLRERPDRLSQANPEPAWRWAGPASRRRFPARSVARLAAPNGALPQKPRRERPKKRKNCLLTSCPSPANIAPCLASPKTNSLSPAQR
jgi:hypothetical protein